MSNENMKKSPEELFKDIDINYINHNIMLTSKTPAYTMIFYGGAIMISTTFQNLNMFIIGIIAAFILSSIAVKLQKENQGIKYINSMFKYMFMPSFFLLKPLSKYKKGKK